MADLESFAAIDYSAVKTTYTNTVVEAWITQAEVLVNKIDGSSYTGTIPENIKQATLAIAKRIAMNQMADDGLKVGGNAIQKQNLVDNDIILMVNKLDKDFYASGVQGSDQ